jgi:riboflavin synthase
MFTGIIEEVGRIKSIKKNQMSASLVIESTHVLEDTQIGDSIATNGVCLTVTSKSDKEFTVDVMVETMRSSNLLHLRPNDQVNLERALTLSTRLGGHLVSGHVDCVGKILDFTNEENAVWITVELSDEVMRYMMNKGSIALDGVSLTIQRMTKNSVSVSIIPHTKEVTTLLTKRIGDVVNVEVDMIAKYVERLLGFSSKKQNIDENFLKEHGFY